MEERIRQVIRQMKIGFVCFWMLPLLLVVAGEIGGPWVGMYADNVRAVYWSETLVILLVALCVPLSLKLFSWVLARKIDIATIAHALGLYCFWNGVRLLLLSVPVLSGFLVYYLMLSNKGALCALIALTASLFCLPSEERLRKELYIEKEDE